MTIAHSTPAEPADADLVGPWIDDAGTGYLFRRFTIHAATVKPMRGDEITVRAEGEQFSSGAEQRVISVDESSGLGALTATDARALAAALLNAAERLDGHRCPVARDPERLRAALAAYDACDDDAAHERAAAMLAAATRRLLV